MDIICALPINIANKVVKYVPPQFSEQLYAEYKKYICTHSSYYKIPWYILPTKLRRQYLFTSGLDEIIWRNFEGYRDVYHSRKYGTIIYFDWDAEFVWLLNSIYSHCKMYDVDHEVIMLNGADYSELEYKFNINLETCTFHARKIGGQTFIILGGE